MASLIPGYNYDIFISYRQKDNKGEKWVSNFVDALKNELESTFKEEISVYFDINPHDGLLETHDVDASLKEKLRCLVFIPIISRTYCDPRSFAWEHEFMAFIKQASKDQFGLKIKLPNGNVANRVLPIRIHDIDSGDIKKFESVTGGILRGIEFIYQEPGVNKPLSPDDDERKNLNGTKYRIQINKVANAIEEIISGLQLKPAGYESEKLPAGVHPAAAITEETAQPGKVISRLSRKIIPAALVAALVIIAVIFLYPKIFKGSGNRNLVSPDGKISIAVMPFRNMTNDTLWNVWQGGIRDILITYLSNFNDNLALKQPESIDGMLQSRNLTNYASLTPSVAGDISRELDASIFISGSISKAGSVIRVNTHLVNSRTEEAIKSFQVEGGSEEDIYLISDSLSHMIKDYLIMSVRQKDIVADFRPLITTHSSEAYRDYWYGNQTYYKSNDLNAARDWYLKAVEIDTNFTEAMRMLAYTYSHLGNSKEAINWVLRLHDKRDQMSLLEKLYADAQYAGFFGTIYETIKCWSAIIDFDDQMPVPYGNLAGYYITLKQYDKAISLLEKALEIYDKWGSKPRWVASYTDLGKLYHITGRYNKEKKLYRKAEQDFPGDYDLLYRQAVLALSEKKTADAKRYIEEYISATRIKTLSEAQIANNLANLYWEADLPNKAEEYFREALNIEPDSPDRMRLLAWFLIDTGRNIGEGVELSEKALAIDPANSSYLDIKAWGEYKQNNLEDAHRDISKAYSLNPINYSISLHKQEIEKALADQKE